MKNKFTFLCFLSLIILFQSSCFGESFKNVATQIESHINEDWMVIFGEIFSEDAILIIRKQELSRDEWIYDIKPNSDDPDNIFSFDSNRFATLSPRNKAYLAILVRPPHKYYLQKEITLIYHDGLSATREIKILLEKLSETPIAKKEGKPRSREYSNFLPRNKAEEDIVNKLQSLVGIRNAANNMPKYHVNGYPIDVSILAVPYKEMRSVYFYNPYISLKKRIIDNADSILLSLGIQKYHFK